MVMVLRRLHRGTTPSPPPLRTKTFSPWLCWFFLWLNVVTATTAQDQQHQHDPRSPSASFSNPPPVDKEGQWFRQKGWNKFCLDLEFVCHDPSSDAWWYDPHVPLSDLRTSHPLHQPEVHLAFPKPHIECADLKLDFLHIHEAARNANSNENANVTSSPPPPPICDYARHPTHLVLYSWYNEMLGEFYTRLVAGMHLAYGQNRVSAYSKSRTQLYLHLYDKLIKRTDKRPQLMESHHAFTAGLRQGVPLLNARDHLWYPEPHQGCTCYRQLVLCGYHHERKERNTTTTHTTNAPHFYYRSSFGNGLLPHFLVMSNLTKSKGEVYNISYRMLRRHVVEENPLAVQNLRDYRLLLLENALVPHYFRQEQSNGTPVRQIQTIVDQMLEHLDADEWKIVGLTQRTKRRRWDNVEEIRKACNQRFIPYRVVCVVVNVEHVQYSPRRHVLIHRALDGLLGIHGAQLTEALWMKPGSLVVEFNPFLPHTVHYGSWTRTTTIPTPLGEIFLDTELFHIGLPLLRDSLTVCQELNGTEAIECIRGKQWDLRNFLAPLNRTLYILETLVVQPRPVTCDDLHNVSDGWILYNVQCADPAENNSSSTNATNTVLVPRTRQFYWEKDLGDISEYRSVDPGILI